jgi:hypothetical protein
MLYNVVSPEAFYFTIFRSFTVRSAFVHSSNSVRSPFVHRSQRVHRSFSVHKAFIVHNLHYHSELPEERTYFCREKMKKEHISKSEKKMKYFNIYRYNTKKLRGSPVCFNLTRHAEFLKSL